MGLALLTILPASRPCYNRFWNALAKPPDDLAMHPEALQFAEFLRITPGRAGSVYASTSAMGCILHATDDVAVLRNGRTYYNDGFVAANDMDVISVHLGQYMAAHDIVAAVPRATALFTPYSFAALCSGHWLPQEAAMAFAGAAQLEAASINAGLTKRLADGPVAYYGRIK
jgi:hypothetical protein